MSGGYYGVGGSLSPKGIQGEWEEGGMVEASSELGGLPNPCPGEGPPSP